MKTTGVFASDAVCGENGEDGLQVCIQFLMLISSTFKIFYVCKHCPNLKGMLIGNNENKTELFECDYFVLISELIYRLIRLK